MTGTEHLNVQDVEHISKLYSSYSKFTPAEYSRKPQCLSKLCKWKSIEFRQFILYTGIVILKDFLPYDAYWHFLLFHAAYRLLDDPRYAKENVPIADAIGTFRI